MNLKNLIPALAIVAASLIPTVALAGGHPDVPNTCHGKAVTIYAQPHQTTHGTAGDDVIMGTSGNDRIYSYGGNDTICLLSGNDWVWAGSGNDYVHDTLTGETRGGNDHIYGEAGDDILYGGYGNDHIDGGSGADYCGNYYGNRDHTTGCETVNGNNKGDG